MIVRDASAADIVHVCSNLRAVERREQFACRFDDDAGALALELVELKHMASCLALQALCHADGEAVSLLGAWYASPGVASIKMMRTGRWDAIRVGAYRHCIHQFIPHVLAPKVHRAHCCILAEHHEALSILDRIGFKREGTFRRVGKAGEDFVMVAWLRDTALAHLKRKDMPAGKEEAA